MPARLPVRSGLRPLLAYQALWLGAVLGAAHLSSGAATAVSAVALLACLAVHPPARVRRALPAAAAGYLSDVLLYAGGVLVFSTGTWLAPAWLAALWLGFAVSFPALFGWLRHRPVLTAVLGGAGGTLSYFSALRLGAASTPDAALFVCVLAPVWSVRLLALRWWWLRPPAPPRPLPGQPFFRKPA